MFSLSIGVCIKFLLLICHKTATFSTVWQSKIRPRQLAILCSGFPSLNVEQHCNHPSLDDTPTFVSVSIPNSTPMRTTPSWPPSELYLKRHSTCRRKSHRMAFGLLWRLQLQRRNDQSFVTVLSSLVSLTFSHGLLTFLKVLQFLLAGSWQLLHGHALTSKLLCFQVWWQELG